MRGWYVVACVLGLALGAEPCSAVGGNIGWDSCGPAGGSNKDFACNSNAGADSFVVSFVPPSGLPLIYLVGCTVEIFTADGSILPDWWQLQGAGCRPSSFAVTMAPGASAEGCDTIPVAVSTWTYAYGPGDLVAAVTGGGGPMAPGVELVPGREYFLARMRVDHPGTVGSDSCAGCSVPMKLVVWTVSFYDAQGFSTRITSWDRQGQITWQAGLVPVISRSWGQIKGLYRR